MRVLLTAVFAAGLLSAMGAAGAPTRLPRSCRAAGLGPCFKAAVYNVAFDGSSYLVRDYKFDDDVGNHRQTHQEITTIWTLRIRGPVDLYLRMGGKPLPKGLRGILPYLPNGGRRSMTERTFHSDDKHGGGTYTCAGHEGVRNTPSGFIRLDHLRPDGHGGYLLRMGSPWPFVLPDHCKIACTPTMVAGQYSGPTDLGDAFNNTLGPYLVTTVRVSRAQLRPRVFKVVADVAKTPPTTCQAGLEVCSQSLHWHVTITFRKWGNCLVSLGAGPSECEHIR